MLGARSAALAAPAVLALLAAVGCVFSETPPLEGLLCNDAHACVDGFSCVGGVCVQNAEIPAAVALSGAFAKGPFLADSSITVATLDAAGAPTGQSFLTTTSDDTGAFSLSLQHRGVVAIEGEGFYFNEVTGQLSLAPLTLRALYDVGDGAAQTAYVNIITHLSSARALALLAQGADLADASAQAEEELFAGVDIGTAPPTAPGTAVALVGPDADAYLLALSAVITEAAVIAAGDAADAPVDASLQELINTIRLDLADDGALDPGIASQLAAAEAALDVEGVVANLEARLTDTGSDDAVPDLGLVIDEDGDGVAHTLDNCPAAANGGQEDADDDGVGDACECGNGAVDPGEACDGAAPPGQTCTPDCRLVDGCLETSDACAHSTDCCAGLACVAGFCAPEEVCIDAGGACAGDPGACCADLACRLPAGTCVDAATCAADGGACTVATDCCSGVCDGAICRSATCAAFQTPCDTTSDCCTGVCDGTVCGCAQNLVDCAGVCVDLVTDPSNCGACGTACAGDCAEGQCVAVPTCGDGLAAGSEVCDGGDLRSTTCVALGFSGGVLACAADCGAFDASGCDNAEICGDTVDNNVNSVADECCDLGTSCTVGFGGCEATGARVCAADGTHSVCDATPGLPVAEQCGVAPPVDDDCDGLIDDGCTCGDGLIAGAEECDDQNTNANDGCSATCGVESGFVCTGQPSNCTSAGG